MCLLSTLVYGQMTHSGESASGLVEQFKTSTLSWKQFDVAKKIVALGDRRVLPDLEPWLTNEDRHRRGNAAFIFGRLGDDRGFQVIRAILEDYSTKRAVFTMGSIGGPNPELEIRQDRWYAVYLFGFLNDSRAVPILVPLLKDKDVKEIVPWSLGQIGDKAAIPPLIEILEDRSPNMRLAAIRALEQLDAKQALPKLHALLNDEFTYFDLSVPVAAAAQRAIIKLERKP